MQPSWNPGTIFGMIENNGRKSAASLLVCFESFEYRCFGCSSGAVSKMSAATLLVERPYFVPWLGWAALGYPVATAAIDRQTAIFISVRLEKRCSRCCDGGSIQDTLVLGDGRNPGTERTSPRRGRIHFAPITKWQRSRTRTI